MSTSLVNIIDAFSDVVAAYDPDALERVFHHNAETVLSALIKKIRKLISKSYNKKNPSILEVFFK